MAALITPEGQLGNNPQSNMLLNIFKGALTAANAGGLTDAAKDNILEELTGLLSGGERSGRKRPPAAMSTDVREASEETFRRVKYTSQQKETLEKTIGTSNVALYTATYGSIQSKDSFNDAVRNFAVSIGYAPTDGGLLLLCFVFSQLPVVRLHDPGMALFEKYTKFTQKGVQGGKGDQFTLGGSQRVDRIVSSYRKKVGASTRLAFARGTVMYYANIRLDDGQFDRDGDDDNYNHQRDLRDAGLAILSHTGKETPEILTCYALIRGAVNERRKGRRGGDGERRSFQHLANGDDPLGDDAFVATVRALALEFKATSISGVPKQLVTFAAFSIRKWLDGKAGPGLGTAHDFNAPTDEAGIFDKFKVKFNKNINWDKVMLKVNFDFDSDDGRGSTIFTTPIPLSIKAYVDSGKEIVPTMDGSDSD